MPAVSQRVILDDELRSDGSIEAQSERCSGIELLVGHLAHRRSRFTAVPSEKGEGIRFRHVCVFSRVSRVHVLHHIPRHIALRSAAPDRLSELYLDGIHARNMMY